VTPNALLAPRAFTALAEAQPPAPSALLARKARRTVLATRLTTLALLALLVPTLMWMVRLTALLVTRVSTRRPLVPPLAISVPLAPKAPAPLPTAAFSAPLVPPARRVLGALTGLRPANFALLEVKATLALTLAPLLALLALLAMPTMSKVKLLVLNAALGTTALPVPRLVSLAVMAMPLSEAPLTRASIPLARPVTKVTIRLKATQPALLALPALEADPIRFPNNERARTMLA